MNSGQKRPFHYLSIIFRIISAVTAFFCIAFIIYVIICNSNGRAVSIFHHSVLKVATGSMEPSIHQGDYIYIEHTDITALKKGDIISFYSSDPDIYNRINTHRIVKINSDGTFITRGDANSAQDSYTAEPQNIIGIYRGKIKLLRWISSFASGRKLLMVFVIIPMALISFYEVITVSRITVEVRKTSEDSQKEEKEKYIRKLIDKEKQKLYDDNYSEVMKDESGKTDEGKTG